MEQAVKQGHAAAPGGRAWSLHGRWEAHANKKLEASRKLEATFQSTWRQSVLGVFVVTGGTEGAREPGICKLFMIAAMRLVARGGAERRWRAAWAGQGEQVRVLFGGTTLLLMAGDWRPG